MQDPLYYLKCIIDDAIDLYRQVKDDDAPKYAPEEIIQIGKDIKINARELVDMAWYTIYSKDWGKKHPGHVGTRL